MFAIALRLFGLVFAFVLAAAATDLDREMVLSPHDGAASEDIEIRRWQERARIAIPAADVLERLGWAYVAKARRTLDAGYYKLAEKTADVIDQRFGASPGSRLLRGHVLHNVHRFRDAENVARQLVAERGLPVDLALLSDVLVEQGKLVEGVALLQRLVDSKPGTEAFARIAHVRWLKGDLAGAIAAMDSAVEASDPRDAEVRAWLFSRLSGFRLQRGEAGEALRLADKASDCAPHFPPALLARGRSLLAQGKTRAAVAALEQAAALQPLPEYQWWLADALAAAGDGEQAAAVELRLRARGAAEDPRTFALFLASRGEDPAQAVRLARAELAGRGDVFSHDALAWALAAAGDLQNADTEIRAALAEGTKDARLFLHAGEISLARGEPDAASRFFALARVAAATLTPSEQVQLARRGPGFTPAGTE